MSYFTTVINWLTSLPASTWYHFGEFLLGGTGISVVIKVISHVKGWTSENGKTPLLQSLVAGFSYVAVTAQSLLSTHIVNLSSLGKAGAALAVVSTFAYRVAVSPLYKKFVTIVDDAAAYRKQVVPPAAAPATSVPATAPVNPTDTFKV